METIRADARQQAHRALWDRKPVLREVYSHLYKRIAAHCRPGLTVEVGGGSGNFKHYQPDALSFDIVPESWLDLVADAQFLPFADATVANIVMLDEATKAEGRKVARRDLNGIFRHQQTGLWQNTGDNVELVSLPGWAFTPDEEATNG